jgi:hypothetical protein
MSQSMRLALILAAMLVVQPAWAAGSAAQPAQKENIFKRIGKQIARDAKAGTKQAGKAYGDFGRSTGRSTVDTTKRVGKEVKDSSKRTAKEARETF